MSSSVSAAATAPAPLFRLRRTGGQFAAFLGDLLKSREMLVTMIRRDFTDRYLGSCLGLIWAFLHPVATIGLMWFVFQVGFKAQPMGNYPFILWLSVGIVSWNFFAEGSTRAASSVLDRAFIVKKVPFRTSLLPLVSIGSALVVHVLFLGILLAMFASYGHYPGLHFLQLPYYLGAVLFLLVGLSWITSSLTVFLRDVPQVVSLLLQIGFWSTPVFWNPGMLPPEFQQWLKLNPILHIVDGYRDCFLGQAWFWEHGQTAACFWTAAIAAFVVGGLLFRRLRPHYADVL